jgi:hypothetical protein
VGQYVAGLLAGVGLLYGNYLRVERWAEGIQAQKKDDQVGSRN